MATTFLGTRITPHLAELTDGSLLCRSVPIARTGTQKYRREELESLTGEFSPDARPGFDGLYVVHRPASEVLSAATIASAEGVPLCDTHPPVFSSPATWATYARGHVQNVREGPRTSDGHRTLIADLICRDSPLAEKILNRAAREVSCGYSCRYEQEADGSFTQRQIVINHVAVVKKGRAGSEIQILDHQLAAVNLGDVLTKLGTTLRRMYDAIPELRPDIGAFFEEPLTEAPAEVLSEQYAASCKRFHRGGGK